MPDVQYFLIKTVIFIYFGEILYCSLDCWKMSTQKTYLQDFYHKCGLNIIILHSEFLYLVNNIVNEGFLGWNFEIAKKCILSCFFRALEFNFSTDYLRTYLQDKNIS